MSSYHFNHFHPIYFQYDNQTQEYECCDEDNDEGTSKPMHVDKHKVIRLGNSLRNIEVSELLLLAVMQSALIDFKLPRVFCLVSLGGR